MATLPDQKEYCKTCDIFLNDWDDLVKHRITSKKHPFACIFCGIESKSEDGRKSHEQHFHAADQDLDCIGCGEHFKRCGNYVEHIEKGFCTRMPKEAFGKLREATESYHKAGTKKKEPVIAEAQNATKSNIPFGHFSSIKTTNFQGKSPLTYSLLDTPIEPLPNNASIGPPVNIIANVPDQSAHTLGDTDYITYDDSPRKGAGWEKWKAATPGLNVIKDEESSGVHPDNFLASHGEKSHDPYAETDKLECTNFSRPRQSQNTSKGNGLEPSRRPYRGKLIPVGPQYEFDGRDVDWIIAEKDYVEPPGGPPPLYNGAHGPLALPLDHDKIDKYHKAKDEAKRKKPQKKMTTDLITDQPFTVAAPNYIGWDDHKGPSGEAPDLIQFPSQFPSPPNHSYKDAGLKVPDLLTGDPLGAAAPNRIGAWVSKKFFRRNRSPNKPSKTDGKLSSPPPDRSGSLSQHFGTGPGLTRSGPDLGTIYRNNNLYPSALGIQAAEPAEGDPSMTGFATPSISLSLGHPHSPYDPDQPGFDLDKYLNPISGLYKCAFPGCTKLQKNRKALYTHLKSEAHTTNLITCPTCLRLFNSAAALIQHLESPANRCNARYETSHGQVIDAVSAGIIGTVAMQAENGARYYSSQTLPDIPLATVPYATEDEVNKAVKDPKYRNAKEKERKERKERKKREKRERPGLEDWWGE